MENFVCTLGFCGRSLSPDINITEPVDKTELLAYTFLLVRTTTHKRDGRSKLLRVRSLSLC